MLKYCGKTIGQLVQMSERHLRGPAGESIQPTGPDQGNAQMGKEVDLAERESKRKLAEAPKQVTPRGALISGRWRFMLAARLVVLRSVQFSFCSV